MAVSRNLDLKIDLLPFPVFLKKIDVTSNVSKMDLFQKRWTHI